MQIKFSNPVGCLRHHVLGWRNIWDSAEHWSWVEGPKGAGEIELCRVLNCILQVVFLHQVHWAAIQPAPAGWLQHIAGNREKSNLDSIHHLCQHCYTGDEDVIYQQFTSIGLFLCQFFSWSIWIWMAFCVQERSLRDNSSLVTVTRNDLYIRQFVLIIIIYRKSYFF